MMPMPSALSWPMILNSCSDSPEVRELVGSSMMISAGVQRQRLGDLHHLHLAGGEGRDRRCGWEIQSDAMKQSPGNAAHLAAPEQAEGALLISQENVPRDVEIRREHQLLMDQGDAKFFGVRDFAENHRLAEDFELSLIGRIGPAEDLHQRAFPAPFSPISASTSPRCRCNETPPSATTPGKSLDDSGHLEKGSWEASLYSTENPKPEIRNKPKSECRKTVWNFLLRTSDLCSNLVFRISNSALTFPPSSPQGPSRTARHCPC